MTPRGFTTVPRVRPWQRDVSGLLCRRDASEALSPRVLRHVVAEERIDDERRSKRDLS